MKIRNGFVSNSSSTAFIITNLTSEEKSLVDFVYENPEIVTDYNKKYGYNEDAFSYNNDQLVDCALKRETTWSPNESKVVRFGDEDGDVIGRVYDYMLRDGGKSPSFKWEFNHYLR